MGDSPEKNDQKLIKVASTSATVTTSPDLTMHYKYALDPKHKSYYAVFIENIQYKDFMCGWGAAFCNITITYPINKIIFRQMLSGMQLIPAVKELYHEGFYYLYRGILPPLIQKSLSLSLMFGVYENSRRPLEQLGVGSVASRATAAIIAGTAEAILMPFERVQTLLSDNSYHTKFRNMNHAFLLIRKEYGVKEYYRGFVPVLLRNGPSNAMFFLLRDECFQRTKLPQYVGSRASDFANGALVGAIVSCVFYPINVVKVAAQSTIGGEYRGTLEILRTIYYERDRSVRQIYRGVTTNCTRSFFSWGIMNVAYQYLHDALDR